MNASTRRLLVACAFFCAASPLCGQQATPENPDESAMAGPKVETEAPKRTLVVKDFGGNLTLLDQRPEFAAVGLFTLESEHAAAYQSFVDDRAAAVAKLLNDEYALILELQAARQGGSEPTVIRPLMQKFRLAAQDLLTPPLKEQVAAVLPQSSRSEYLAVVDEYTTALAAFRAAERNGNASGAMTETAGDSAPAGRRGNRGGGGAADRVRTQSLELTLLLREVGNSLNALVESRRERSDEMLKAINATPEQEAKLRAITRAKSTGLGVVAAQDRSELFQKIAAELTPEQRRLLMEYLRKN